ERDRLAPEEAEAVDREGGHRAEHQRGAGCQQADLERQPERRPHVGVRPRDAEPVSCPSGQRPALHVRLVERVDPDQHERRPEEEEHEGGPDAKRDAGTRGRHSASKAPNRRATTRYTAITITGMLASAAANGTLALMPMFS